MRYRKRCPECAGECTFETAIAGMGDVTCGLCKGRGEIDIVSPAGDEMRQRDAMIWMLAISRASTVAQLAVLFGLHPTTIKTRVHRVAAKLVLEERRAPREPVAPSWWKRLQAAGAIPREPSRRELHERFDTLAAITKWAPP